MFIEMSAKGMRSVNILPQSLFSRGGQSPGEGERKCQDMAKPWKADCMYVLDIIPRALKEMARLQTCLVE